MELVAVCVVVNIAKVVCKEPSRQSNETAVHTRDGSVHRRNTRQPKLTYELHSSTMQLYAGSKPRLRCSAVQVVGCPTIRRTGIDSIGHLIFTYSSPNHDAPERMCSILNAFWMAWRLWLIHKPRSSGACPTYTFGRVSFAFACIVCIVSL